MRGRIDRALGLLGENPDHPGLETHKIKGKAGVFESYIDRANRITWHYDAEQPSTIVLRANCNHDVLRNP